MVFIALPQNHKKNLHENNPFYAVERIYETADKWKRNRNHINTKLLAKVAPLKPAIYSKQSNTSPKPRSTRSISPDVNKKARKRPLLTSKMVLEAI